MRPADQIELMPPIEFLDDILSKHVTDSSVVVTPALNVDLGVGPQQVTHQTLVGYLLRSVLLVYNLEVVQVWTKTSMHTQNPVIHDGRHRQHVESESKFLPDLNIVPSFALVVESIHSVDRLALVVASQQEKVVRKLDFECEQQTDSFD